MTIINKTEWDEIVQGMERRYTDDVFSVDPRALPARRGNRCRVQRFEDGVYFDSVGEAARSAGLPLTTFAGLMDSGKLIEGKTYLRVDRKRRKRDSSPSRVAQAHSEGFKGFDLSTIHTDESIPPNTIYAIVDGPSGLDWDEPRTVTTECEDLAVDLGWTTRTWRWLKDVLGMSEMRRA